jgi:tetratricopeptide (TPR) repeat protein
MKKVLTIAVALLMAAFTLSAQNTPPAPQKPASGAQPPAAVPDSAMGAQQQPKVAKAPEAKSQEEFKAYQDAAAVTDINAGEAAADDFAKKFPQSELRVSAYGAVLQKAYEAGNSEKVIEIGRKFLALDPESPMTLVVTATALAENTKETDLDAAQKTEEANKYLNKALANIETMLPQPGVTPEQFANLQAVLRNMAHAAKGYMAMNKKDYAAAESAFQKAIEATPAQPDATLYLRLAVTQDNQGRFAPAFANANKAMQIAQEQNNSVVANLARGERDRLQKLMNNAPGAPKK